MKHYLMLPQDTIRVLPPEDGQEACVELFCERVAIYFPVETLTVTHFTGVLVDKAREDALASVGRMRCSGRNIWCCCRSRTRNLKHLTRRSGGMCRRSKQNRTGR